MMIMTVDIVEYNIMSNKMEPAIINITNVIIPAVSQKIKDKANMCDK
jgi:hypothetical protein